MISRRAFLQLDQLKRRSSWVFLDLPLCGNPSWRLSPLGTRNGASGGPCCMDHPEGCLIMVFFNTGDNLDAT